MATKDGDAIKGLEKYLKPAHFEDNALVPAHVVGTLLPPWELIPDEFKAPQRSEEKIYEKVLVVKDGIDKEDAKTHLSAIALSMEPDLVHRMAGVRFLRSLWFEDAAKAFEEDQKKD